MGPTWAVGVVGGVAAAEAPVADAAAFGVAFERGVLRPVGGRRGGRRRGGGCGGHRRGRAGLLQGAHGAF